MSARTFLPHTEELDEEIEWEARREHVRDHKQMRL